MTLNIPANPKFNISATSVAWVKYDMEITFWRSLDSTIKTIKMPCSKEMVVDRLEQIATMSDSDFSWMSDF